MEVITEKRTDTDERLNRAFREAVEDLDRQVDEHKTKREKEEADVLDMLKESVERIKSSIDKERAEREDTERGMLNLLEEACDKLNEISH